MDPPAAENEKPADEDGVVVVGIAKSPAAAAAEGCPPSRPIRRCVQKKLSFFQSGGGDNKEEAEEEFEESDGEKKRKRKGKGKAKSTVTPPGKIPVTRVEIPEHESTNTVSFFTKASQKRLLRRQEKEAHETTPPIMKIEQSPKKTMDGDKNNKQPEGNDGSSTPCKDLTCTNSKSPASSKKKLTNRKSNAAKISSPPALDKGQSAPDLWLEAKAASEEYTRLSAGKQLHPFFSNCKMAKRSSGTSENVKVEIRNNFDLSKESPPIHVLDSEQSNPAMIDWSRWNIKDSCLTCVSSHFGPETLTKSMLEGNIEPLKYDTVPNELDFCLQEQLLDKTSGTIVNLDTPSTLLDPEQVALQASEELPSERNLNCEDDGISLPSTSSSDTPKKLQQKQTIERSRHSSFSDPRLWTNKYRPEKGSEVCGNAAAIKFLSEWLQSWHGRRLPTSRSNNMVTNDSFDLSDSDVELEDELANVLLVTGPVGCGKSAAIYACAAEHGFEVIEVNASDHRHGSLVKQKFGEATESHGLELCTVDNHASKDGDLSSNPVSSQIDKDTNKHNVNNDFEVASWTCKQDFLVHGNTEEGIKTSTFEVTNKSLILFEDVDTVFEEDRGFLGTVLQLAETSKRPIVLTANNKDPVLPHSLVRQVIEFAFPSHEELLSLLSMICAAEGTHISSTMLTKFIRSCQTDIRKAILHLQFWCQGKGNEIGENKHCAYSPLQFDVDAAHMVTPQLVPWGCTCNLSKIIEEDIAKVDQLILNTPIFVHAAKNKKRKLIKNATASNILHSEENTNGGENDFQLSSVIDTKLVFSPFKDCDTLTNVSSSPVKFVRRTKNRPSIVLSSESGDEDGNQQCGTEDRLGSPTTNLSLDVSLVPLSCSVECLGHDALSNSQEDACTKIPETTISTIWDMSNSFDMSCVPESLILAGNESNHGTVFLSNMPSSGHFPTVSDDALGSSFKLLFPCSVPVDEPKLDIGNETQSKIEDSTDDVESVHENEENEDIDNGRDIPSATHFVDECSRADFGTSFACTVHDESYEKAKHVQETWRRLRSCHEEYRSYLSNNCKVLLQALELSSNLTSLLSDTDIMLADCETYTTSPMDPPMVRCIESVSASWSDDQVEMASTSAQHGICYYAITSTKLGQMLGALGTDPLGQEMLKCNTSLMAAGKLFLQERNFVDSKNAEYTQETGEHICSTSIGRERESVVRNLILPLIPDRAWMTLKGNAFHEYMASLSQISKLENSRLSQEINGEQRHRRGRRFRHYLDSTLYLSSEDIATLAQQCCFRESGLG